MRRAARAAALLLALAGCVDPSVKLFPPAPIRVDVDTPGETLRWYDTDLDGRPDYAESGPDAGRVSRLLFDDDEDGRVDESVEPTAAETGREIRDLVIILDSIPFSLVRETWAAGRFRLFHPPSAIISTFPVMTDPALAELFGASPCPSLEASAYDGRRLTDGYAVHASSQNIPWAPFVDYRLPPVAHMFVYTTPDAWYPHELKDIQDRVVEPNRRRLVAYVVSTSSVGVYQGRDGHFSALVALDRLCRWVTHHFRGRVRITLMSDHGHNHVRSRRIPLEALLTEFGYRVCPELERTGDVVLPAFGMVTVAAIHTHEPESVSADLAGVEGVAQTLYRDGNGGIVVLSRNGRAVIRRAQDRFGYFIERGDPLELLPVIARLESTGRMSPDGFASDAAWFEATADHDYPDALQRIWRAFDGLLIHVPDVLVSVEDGYHCGDEFMSDYVGDVRATHGNLHRSNSIGFVMTTAGELPPVLRMSRTADALQKVGVTLPGRSASTRSAD